MNNQGTIEKLNQMKLHGMARAFGTSMEAGVKKNFTADELLAHLVDSEWDYRYNRKLIRLIRAAKFRYQASIEEVDYAHKRKLDRNLVLRLSNCEWLKKGQSIIITGKTGLGKSYLVTAFGMQCCHYGHSVLYFNSGKLFTQLKMAQTDGSYPRMIKKIAKADLLILDDFGLHPFDMGNRLSLLEIIEDRHSRKSTIIATQFPPESWHELIGDPTIADAVCDRLIHTAHRISLDGKSMRNNKGKEGKK